MTQQHPPNAPRRSVRYRMGGDALGHFITFTLDEILLPENVPPHMLPPGTRLQRVELACRFSGSSSLGAHELRSLFLEFAGVMNWEAHLDP